MSVKNIVEEVVKMTFDNAGFEKNIKESQKSIEDLRNSINMDGSAKALSIIQNSVDSLNNRFSALGIAGMTAIQNITNKAIDMATQLSRSFAIDPMKQGFGEYELKMGSIQTIMASTGADLDTVNQKLDELNTYADKTIYSFSDMTQNIGKFTNAGVKLDDAVAAIQGVSNVAAVSGANANEASRAMYNFAQALSAGYVKLIDWKSIENANMATVEFKQQLIDTAVEMGTLVKVGDDYKSVTKDNNGKVSDLFNTTKNFNDALSSQWMTTDVLTTTLAKYADETTDIGKKAFAAAQDVKTFSQLIDTIKEAIGSGWSRTFEIIIGDFNEAKELFTSINNVVSSFVDNMSDARNNLLEAALGPKKIKEEVITSGDAVSYASSKLEEYKKIAQEVENGQWGNGEERIKRLTEAGYNYDAVMMIVNDDLNYTEFNMDKFTEAVGEATSATEELTSANEKTGRELLIESFANVAKGAGKIFKSVGEAYRSIFPPMTAERLRAIIERFNEFTKGLIVSDKTAHNLKNTFKGVFTVFRIFGNAVSAVIRVLSPLVDVAKSFVVNFLQYVMDPLGRFVTSIGAVAEKTDFFYKVLDTIRQLGKAIFEPLVNGIGNFLDKIGITLPKADSFSKTLNKTKTRIVDFMTAFDGTKTVERFKEVISNLGDFLAPVGSIFETAGKKIVDFFKSFLTKDADEAEDKVSIFGSLVDRVKERFHPLGIILEAFGKLFSAIFDLAKRAMPVFSKIGSVFADVFSSILDAISNGIMNFDFDKVFDLLNTGIFSSILLSIAGFAKGLNKAGDKLSFDGIFGKVTDFIKDSPFGNIVKIFDDVREAIGAWTANIQSKTLRNIAVSIAILAASLIALSLVDSEKLTTALGAITALFLELISAMTALDKLTGDNKRITQIGKAMVSMAAAILILAISLRILAKLDSDDLAKGLIGIGALMAELYLFIKGMEGKNFSKKSIAGVISLVIGIRILVGAVKKLAELDTESLVKGLAGLGALFLELGLFMASVSNNKNSFKMSQGIAIVALAVALRIMIGAVAKMAEMDTKSLIKGLIAIGALLLEIGIFSRVFSKMKISSGVGLILLAGAMAIFAKVLRSLGDLSLKQIGKGLLAVGGGLLIMALAANAMKKALKGAAAMLIMSVGLIAMAGAIKLLGSMSLDQVVVALIAMAGAFLIFGIAGYALAPVTGVLLALTGAMALFGVACLAIGAGVLMLATGLGMLAVSGAGAAVSLQVILASILGLVPLFFKQLALGIVEFLGVIQDSASAISDTFITIVNSACAALEETIPTIVDTAFTLIDSVLDKLISNGPDSNGPELIDKLITFVLQVLDKVIERAPELVDKLISLLTTVLDAVALRATDIINSVIGLVTALLDALKSAVPTLIDAFVGVITSIIDSISENVDKFVDSVSDLVDTICTAIGSLIGSIIGGLIDGIISGASDSLDSLGKTLGSFMTNADDFFEAVKVVDNDAVQGVINLVKVIWALTKQEVLDKLTGWRNRTTLSDFGDKLVEFGPKFKQYYESVKDIDYGVVSASAIVMKALIVLSKEIPNSGGLVSYFTGDNKIDDWGVMLVKFGYCLKKYGEHVKDVDTGIVVQTSRAMSTLVQLSREIPDTGGIFTFFTGDNAIDDFGKMLVSFGYSFKKYSQTVKGVDTNVLDNTTSVMDSLVELAREIPNSGGLVSLFTGDNTFSGFGDQLETFAGHFVTYSNKVKEVDWGNVYRVKYFIASMLDVADLIAQNENLGALSAFGIQMSDLGNQGLYQFINAVENSAEDLQNAADGMIKAFVDQVYTEDNIQKFHDAGYDSVTKFNGGVNDKIPDVQNRVKEDIIQTIIDTLMKTESRFRSIGRVLINDFAYGIRDKEVQVHNVCIRLVNAAYDALRQGENSAYNAGQWTAYGFCAGMGSKFDQVYNTAYNMGITAANAARRALMVKSPSRVFAEIGEYTGEGFAIGIRNQYENVAGSSEEMGRGALDAIHEIVSRVNDILNGTEEFHPTITPVLDLTKVNEGVGVLGGLFSDTTMHLAIPGVDILGDSVKATTNVDIKDQVRQGVLEALKQNPVGGGDTNNFYIDGSGSDTNEIADAVIDKLNLRYNQRRAVFG